MSTEATNKLQGSTGALNPVLLNSGGATTTADAGAFNDTFTQQFQQLQADLQHINNLHPQLLADSKVSASLTADSETLLQNFAAVFGNALPPTQKMDQSINLDGTLDALHNVLHRLQALGAPTNSVSLSTPTAMSAFIADQPDISVSELPKQAETNSDTLLATNSLLSPSSSSLDDTLEEARLMTDQSAVSAPEQQVLKTNDLPAETPSSAGLISSLVAKGDKSTEENKPIKERASLKMPIVDPADALSVPMSMLVSTGEELAGMPLPAEEALDLDVGSVPSKDSLVQESSQYPKLVMNSSQEHGAILHSQSSLLNSNPMANGFEQHFNALLGLESAGESTVIMESTSSVDADKNTFLPPADNGIPASETGIEKSTFNFSSELQKLNHSLSSQSANPSSSSMIKTMNDPAWPNELGDKLIWMHKQAVPSVELRLNPEHLGPVLIKIDVQNDQASVSFSAQHQAVKEAIEASIPKLREMLGGQQLQLTDVNVSQHQGEQRQGRDFYPADEHSNHRQTQNDEDGQHTFRNDGQDIMEEIEAGRAIATNGLLSLFA